MRAEVMTPPATDSPSQLDETLLNRSRQGDRDAFGELVTAHQRRIWRVCRQYVGPDDADTATQETFVKAYTRLGAFDGRAAFTTWLTRIAINTCLDMLRRRKREALVDESGEDEESGVLDHLSDESADPEAHTMHRQAVQRLRRILAGLPEGQQRVFRMRFHAELELEEIARALDVHVGTVKTQLHRAVHRVRAELGAYR